MRADDNTCAQMTRVFLMEPISLNRGAQNIESPVHFKCRRFKPNTSADFICGIVPTGHDQDVLHWSGQSQQSHAGIFKSLQPKNVKSSSLTVDNLRKEDICTI